MHSTTRILGSYRRCHDSNRRATLLLAATFAALAAAPLMACDGCVVWPDDDRTHGPPIHTGDYAVGFDFARTDDGVSYAVWYPADHARTRGLRHVQYRLSDGFLVDPQPVQAFHGAPVSEDAPNVLLLYSHGGGSLWFDMYPMMELLASHGFVVVAPSHLDRLGGEDPRGDILFPRLEEAFGVVDEMMARSADPSDRFFGRVQTDRMGMMGYSNGGMTAMASATLLPGVGSGPSIAAVFAIDGVWTQGLDSIDQPVFLLSGGREPSGGSSADAVYPALTSSPARYHANLPGANHVSFSSAFCFIGTLHQLSFGLLNGITQGFADDFVAACAPDAPIHVDEVERLKRIYSVSFMRRHLLGEREYDEYLTAERPLVDLEYDAR